MSLANLCDGATIDPLGKLLESFLRVFRLLFTCEFLGNYVSEVAPQDDEDQVYLCKCLMVKVESNVSAWFGFIFSCRREMILMCIQSCKKRSKQFFLMRILVV